MSRTLLILVPHIMVACSSGPSTSDGNAFTPKDDMAGNSDLADSSDLTDNSDLADNSDTVGCKPSCAKKNCGPDGCGGTCGTCSGGKVCSLGQCVVNCTPDCTGKPCGQDGCGGTCGSCPPGNACTDLGGLAYCGFPCDVLRKLSAFGGPRFCLAGTYCHITHDSGAPPGVHGYKASCEDSCVYEASGQDVVEGCSSDHDCCDGLVCEPSTGVTGIPFGFGWCKGCMNESCQSHSDCCTTNPYCGDAFSGTGLFCTSTCWDSGSRCAETSDCCAGMDCLNHICTVPCTPDCADKQCGPDGCGGSCGACPPNAPCMDGACQECVPYCAAKQCGPDTCGGSCGTCSGGTICLSGSCECDPVQNSGCMAPNQCVILSNETLHCAVAGTGTSGSYCSSSTPCAGGHACFSNVCRKVCKMSTGDGCPSSQTCIGVSGWTIYGACS